MGEQYAVRVLDSLETGQDAQALANLHNNFAGRLVLRITKVSIAPGSLDLWPLLSLI